MRATVNVVTHRFGPLEVPDEDVFVFPAGLPGFARLKKFTFVQHRPDTPFRWLQSMESPSVAFVVADPTLIVADYAPPLKPSDLAAVEARDGDDLVMLVVLNVKGEPLGMSANLKAPLLFNPRPRLGTQVILEGERAPGADRYLASHPVRLREPSPGAPARMI